VTVPSATPLSAMLRNERDEAHSLVASDELRQRFPGPAEHAEAVREWQQFADLMDRAARQMDEMLELLRQASPPFGQTEPVRAKWAEDRANILNQE
jgi:hypothetical protein